MAGSFDSSGLEKLGKDLQKLQKAVPKMVDKTAKDLAGRVLTLTVKRTPVGDYSGESYVCAAKYFHEGHYQKGKIGGTLRRSWIINGPFSYGGVYVCELLNPVEYAPYVEYGHITGGLQNVHWVHGHFMLTKSLIDLKKVAPKVIQKNIDDMMKEVF